jgi:hypothetical protein
MKGIDKQMRIRKESNMFSSLSQQTPKLKKKKRINTILIHWAKKIIIIQLMELAHSQ